MISAVIQYTDKSVSIHSAETEQVGKTFGKGFYSVTTDREGKFHINKESLSELHKPFNTKENSIIFKTVHSFFKEGIKKKVNTLEFTHKLGILLYGKQGTSKTSLMNYIANLLVKEKDAFVFFCNTTNTLTSAMNLANSIREIQNNPIVFIADEFERYAEKAESEIKDVLDGNNSIENSLFLAATNYVDRVPATIKDRPSRFKVVQEIKGITQKSTMREVLKNMSDKLQPNLFTEEEVKSVTDNIKSVTIDELKHIALDKLTDNYLPKQSDRRSIGFSKDKTEEDEEVFPDWFKEFKWSDDFDEPETKKDTNI